MGNAGLNKTIGIPAYMVFSGLGGVGAGHTLVSLYNQDFASAVASATFTAGCLSTGWYCRSKSVVFETARKALKLPARFVFYGSLSVTVAYQTMQEKYIDIAPHVEKVPVPSLDFLVESLQKII